ncbi:MAG: hypothetical protein GY722_04115 [bacterium]|nr:hypothetical protein [bacterium]
MSTPIKGNEEIRSDREAFIDAYLRARDVFGRIDNVVGVGFCRKETGDAITSDLAITVFVREKRAEDDIPSGERIPPTFDGYRTDVRIPPEVEPAVCDNQTRYTTIQGGIQIQARATDSTATGLDGAGTLGCIVRKRGNDSEDNYYLLTAGHALFYEDKNTHETVSEMGSLVHHPVAPDAGVTTSAQMIATIEDNEVMGEVTYYAPRPNGSPFPLECYVDCGIARLDLASRCCGIQCGTDNVQHASTIIDIDPGGTNNQISDVRDITFDPDIVLPGVQHITQPVPPPVGGVIDDTVGDLTTATDANRVVKVGRTTGRTVGVVLGVGLPAIQGSGYVQNLIEIQFDPASTTSGLNCHNNPLFIEGGDSGSLVLDLDNKAVGLAIFSRAGINKEKRCFACHIVPVLDELNITIPTTGGTGHGSSHATDGSGIARYGGSTSHLQDDGTVLFAAHSVTGDTSVETDVPPLPAVTQSQNDSVTKWLDAIGKSEAGSRLHDAYAETRREITFLVRKKRHVTVVWHRNRGPAFLAGLLEHLRGDTPSFPKEIGDVSRATLLARMETVLQAHGSNALRDAIARYRDDVMRCAGADTVQECIERLRNTEEEVIS